MNQARQPAKPPSVWMISVRVVGLLVMQTALAFAPYATRTTPDHDGAEFNRACGWAMLMYVGDVVGFLIAVGVVFAVIRWRRNRPRNESEGAGAEGGSTTLPPA